MAHKIRVAILDDHQGIIDGYQFRLQRDPAIEVIATLYYGEDLLPTLARCPVDVLLLDIQVPTSASNRNPYPIPQMIARLLTEFPALSILVISMYAQPALINMVMEAGASGYILKDDQALIRGLPAVVHRVAAGEIQMSAYAGEQLRRSKGFKRQLSQRQQEALALCAAYPSASTEELAHILKIAPSTFRNLLSSAYVRLDVPNRSAAVSAARQLGLLSPDIPPASLQSWSKPEE